MKSLKDFVAKKSLSSDTLSLQKRDFVVHTQRIREQSLSDFLFWRGTDSNSVSRWETGFSDGKNEVNRLALGIKPRTTLKAVFGRVARNTPPGRFGACLPSVPCKKYGNVCFRTILFRRPVPGRRNLHFRLVFFRYL